MSDGCEKRVRRAAVTQEREELREVVPSREALSFGELARGLARGTISRRRALKVVGTTILGGWLLTLFPKPAEARPRCTQGVGCDNECTDTRRTCVCIETA